MSATVIRYRGCLAAMPSDTMIAALRQLISQYEQVSQTALQAITGSDEWHVTFATKNEMRQMTAQQIEEVLALPANFQPVAVGGYPSQNMYFIVCLWPKAQTLRQRIGLPRHDFHVTISPTNKHDVDKSYASLLHPEDAVSRLGLPTLEALTRELLFQAKFDDALSIAQLLCTKFGTNTTRGWIRLGDAALELNQSKLAMLSHAFAMTLDPSEPSVSQYCVSRMHRCASTTEWGPVFHNSELDQVPVALRANLLRRWPRSITQQIATTITSSSKLMLPSREKLHVLAHSTDSPAFYQLPRFFRWVVPFVLASMSTPCRQEDIQHLALSVGIRHIVTLTEEQPLPAAWFAAVPTVRNTYLPVANYKAPSTEQIDLFMSLFVDDNGSVPVLVHCGGGKGRAGVMLACYLVAFGFSAPIAANKWQHPAMTGAAAIEALRVLRPGSVETKEQENAVAAYCSLLWKRQRLLPLPVTEPPPSTPIVEGLDIAITDLLVLCGLPGAGKTSFRSMLVKRARAAFNPRNRRTLRQAHSSQWLEVSGDEHGRAGCERTLSNASATQRVVLDRCNGKEEDRRLFLSLAQWSTHATAVWFDFPAALCEHRAQQRAAHPTLSPGSRVRNALADHVASFTPPSLAEGFNSVVRITSLQAASALIDMLCPPLRIGKFPRTPHLINLGAATPDDEVLFESVHPRMLLEPRVSDLEPLELQERDPEPHDSDLEPHESDMKLEDLLDPRGSDVEIVITEKVDGANMGITLDANGHALVVQNRSHFIAADSHPQFKKLDGWLAQHREGLMALLYRDPFFPQRFILFGEWLVATHSIAYTKLKGWFYAFGLYDRELHQFVDRRTLEALLQDFDIPLVPVLWRGHKLPATNELITMVQQPSQFYDGRVEGVYIKWEQGGMVKERAKVVRSDFIAGNEHWTKGPLQLNRLVL